MIVLSVNACKRREPVLSVNACKRSEPVRESMYSVKFVSRSGMLIPVSGGEPFREVMRFAGALVDMCRREMYNCLNTRDFGISMVRSVRDPMRT